MEIVRNTARGLGPATRKTVSGVMLLFLLSPAFVKAQRQRVYSNGVWLSYIGNIHINERTYIQAEAELHTKRWLNRWAEQVVDLGVVNRVNARWRVSAGAAWYRSAQYLDRFFFKNDYRLWQEVMVGWRGKVVFNERAKVEERWLQRVSNGKKLDSFEYITRVRLRSEWQLPLHHGTVTPVIGEEFMFNPAYFNSNRFVDQNRAWVGVHLKVSHTTTLQALYLKLFQWRTNNTLEDQNVFRLNIVQHFNAKG